MRHALVTGGAGFIGSHLVDGLLADGWRVTVVDDFDPFYPRPLKDANIAGHVRHPAWRLVQADVAEPGSLDRLEDPVDVIVHLAAKVGVRPSIAEPLA